MEIKILDIGISNIQSVVNAFKKIDKKISLCTSINDFKDADGYVLPGVGTFDSGMKNIHHKQFDKIILSEIKDKKKPLLGICLGMQLLFTNGTENNTHSKGLDLLSGDVLELTLPKKNNKWLKLPHMGWNNVSIKQFNGIFRDINQDTDFYFLHSYHVKPKNENIISSVSSNGFEFVSAFEFENISGVQFHPEKSQSFGLKLLQNWCNKIGRS